MKKLLFFALSSLIFMSCKKETNSEINKDTDNTVTTSEKKDTLSSGYNIGDAATDFDLQGVDGKNYSLANFKEAKGFIVIFTCNHCPYAKAYENRIIALNEKYQALGYPVIAINPNNPEVQPEDSFEKMQLRAKEKNFTFPYLFDKDQKIFPQYGAKKTPHVYVLQKKRNFNVVRYIGAIDNNHENENDVTDRYVENAVDALLSGNEIKQKQTVAIGCSIKTK